MDKYTIIVAGGRGLRMESDIPKQFLLLAGKPVLMHTLEAFRSAIEGIQIILVLPSDQMETWESLVSKYAFEIDHRIVEGGETRFDSVKNGLVFVSENGLVAIHDGVRPLVSKDVIIRSFEGAAALGNAFANAEHSDFTDDAGVLEHDGVKINLIEGDYKNIKITTKEDLLFAASILT